MVLVIEDNGEGFDPEAMDVKERGIGLMGMKERAALIGASFEIESRPGDGTSIFLRYPVGGNGPEADR
jgi:signal transduction histidine kinase